jgi:hypothetical protein
MIPLKRNNILDVFADRKSIDRNPVYQRISGVWDLRKRQLFIDSIVNSVDIPKMYFHELMPPQRGDDQPLIRYSIIDGKQRLETIWSFMDDEFPLAPTFEFFENPKMGGAEATYSSLATHHPLLRARFDATDLPIVVVQTSDLELVEALFSRLNEAVPLTAPEYRNTLGGPLPRKFRELATEDFFQRCLPFDTGRHRYLDLAAKFFYITHRRDFVATKKADLDEFVRSFKRGREAKEASAREAVVSLLVKRTTETVRRMTEFFDEKDPLLSNVGWITLFFQLFRLMEGHRWPKGLTREQFVSFTGRLSETRAILRAITKGELVNKTPVATLQQFVNLGQSSNDGAAILGRYRIVREYFEKEFAVALPSPEV